MNYTFKNLQFLLIFILGTAPGYAQIEFSGEVNLRGMLSSNDELPFWMHRNQRGRVSSTTNFTGWINGKANYEINRDKTLEIGGGILYQDAFKDEVFLDELYAQYKNSWLTIIVGRKQRKELYDGLSATNENILWSLNSRPMPGLQFKTNAPIFFSRDRKWGFEASWSEYIMEKDRFVEFARVHHKSISLIYQPNQNLKIKAGLQHFAQWAGTSTDPEVGKQPQGFVDYLRIVTGRGGGENSTPSDQANVLGNHIGSYEFSVTKGYKDFSLSFIYNSIFEDGSGSRFANIPDGRYGIFMKYKDKDRLFNAFMYEFYYTKNQSRYTFSGADNYFNNGPVYNSGWTYEKRVLGAPFFTEQEDGLGIKKNAFLVHHIGFGGQFSNYFHSYPYKLLLSMVGYEGSSSIGPEQEMLFLDYQIRVFQSFVDIGVNLSAEYDSFTSPNYGAGIHVSKSF